MQNHKEERIQEAIVKRFWDLKSFGQFKIDCILLSNRNENSVGGAKGIMSGARYKRMGRVSGIPDLSLIYEGSKIAFIEVKTPERHRTSKGKETKSRGMSASQIEFEENFIKPLKIRFEVCSSVVDFENFTSFLR